jgi:hypothetical protein
LVALALRLADHIGERLEAPDAQAHSASWQASAQAGETGMLVDARR